MVNNVRWGYIRQGVDDAGASDQPAVFLNGLTDLTPFTRSSSFIVPVNNLIDNYSWNLGYHLVEVIMGFLPEGDGVYNFTRSGQALPQGTPLARDYTLC